LAAPSELNDRLAEEHCFMMPAVRRAPAEGDTWLAAKPR
jgi:hypothetical protein